MAKTIVFCADGTWNNAGTESENYIEAHSNVHKLFDLLQGEVSAPSTIIDLTGRISETEKTLKVGDETTQIAKYINGVGNSKFKFNRVLGGAFGFGLIERIARGYTFISRNYEPGDQIVIIGFSRGAYTARALAGLIANKGVLAKKYPQGDEQSYDMAERAWYYYRDALIGRHRGLFARLQNRLTALTSINNFLTRYRISDADFIPNVPILALGVWDTVGSLGIPDFEFDDERAEVRDVFGFADLELSPKVQYGLHAVALDEQRLMFTPTLWNARENIEQVLFCGAHADVGGGYQEAGLSNIALRWMLNALANPQIGLQFTMGAELVSGDVQSIAHKEWAHLVNATNKVGARDFKEAVTNGQVTVHESIAKRRALAPFVQYAGEQPRAYEPNNY